MRATSEAEVVEAVREARETGRPLEIVGHGTKRAFGRPVAGEVLEVSALAGIVAYEPEELIVTVRPGTTILELTDALAGKGQVLGFEPPEWAPLFGNSGRSTIGGAISVDASGPRRLRFGGARDQLLGIRAVNGLGEAFKAGGRVVKNVTGFDIPKLVCGAFGTLCVLTELTFRVFPQPQECAVLAARDVDPEPGFALLRRVWSSPIAPAALTYIPSGTETGSTRESRGTALIRLEGTRGVLADKIARLRALAVDCAIEEWAEGAALLAALADGEPFVGSACDVWHAHIPPASAVAFALSLVDARWYADRAGGFFWIELPAGNASSRSALLDAALQVRGHAILVRADAATRARCQVFPVESKERAALTRAVREAFDPLSLFNRGRMVEV